MIKNFLISIFFTISLTTVSFAMEQQNDQQATDELNSLFDDVKTMTQIEHEFVPKYELPSWMNRVGYWFVLRYIALKNCSNKLYQNCKQKIQKLAAIVHEG